MSTIPESAEPKTEEQHKSEVPISSSDLIKIHSSEDSVQSTIPSEVKKQKPKARRQSDSNKMSAKRPSAPQLKNKNKKVKAIESSDEEMEIIQTEDPKPDEPVVPKEVIQIDSSVSTSQSNGCSDQSPSKSKPRIKGPKSRQKTVSKTCIETVCEEPKPKPKKQKTYVSSDEEVDEVF